MINFINLNKVEISKEKSDEKYVFINSKTIKKEKSVTLRRPKLEKIVNPEIIIKPLIQFKQEEEPQRKESPKATELRVIVYTSDLKNKKGEGTDAKVYVNIIGEKGETGNRVLTNENNKRKLFEAGSIDEFVISCDDIGNIKKLRVGHDNSGLLSGWHLNKVSFT